MKTMSDVDCRSDEESQIWYQRTLT